MRGLFITVEGIEGSGKSTQIALLRDYLEAKGYEVDVTREPGGVPIAEAIRGILLDPANAGMSSETELFLYEAARAQHVSERVLPAVERGVIVLCDRFSDSTTAYQGAGRRIPADAIERMHLLATKGLSPDLTLLIDLPAEEGLARAKREGDLDRIERESLDFHGRVRDGFLELAVKHPGRIKVIDGTEPAERVADRVRELVSTALESGNVSAS